MCVRAAALAFVWVEWRGGPEVYPPRWESCGSRGEGRLMLCAGAAAPAPASHPGNPLCAAPPRRRPRPILTNERAPSPVDDRWHRFGLYTAQHATTCQDRPGSFTHEERDAATYCAWGVDYVKVRCGSGGSSWVKDAPSSCDDVKASAGRSPPVSSASAFLAVAWVARGAHVAARTSNGERRTTACAPTAFSRALSQTHPPSPRTHHRSLASP